MHPCHPYITSTDVMILSITTYVCVYIPSNTAIALIHIITYVDFKIHLLYQRKLQWQKCDSEKKYSVIAPHYLGLEFEVSVANFPVFLSLSSSPLHNSG